MTDSEDPRPSSGPARLHLRLLATTDLHAEMMPYDYNADRPQPARGLACTATLIAEARAEAANVLLFDNGDLLQGTPLGDLWARRGVGESAHPVIEAMNLLGYDAATVGNHDFNYGLDFLSGALAGARFPVVSANAVLALGDDPAGDRTLLPPFVVLTRELRGPEGRLWPLRVGVIGFLPPQVPQWDRAVLGDRLATREIAEAAQGWVPAMRAAGCDLVVALCHSGIGEPEALPGQEDAAVPLARVPGVDVLVTGHSHLVFPSPRFEGLAEVDATAGRIAGKPAVMAGARGSHLGVIDLELERAADGWRVVAAAVEARPVERASGPAPADPALLDRLARPHAETLAHARQPIGRSLAAMTSHFALVAPSATVALVAEAQARHVAQKLAGTAFAGVPVLSAAAPFRAGGRAGPGNYTEIPAGTLALRHAADLYIYPNLIAALRLSGAQLAEWIERAASLFCRLTPGERDQPLIDASLPSYTFDLVHGLDFAIDLSEPARYDPHGRLIRPEARRIRDLAHRGRPVAPDDSFVIATNSYRAGGAARFFGEIPVWMGAEAVRDIVARHIAETSPLTPAAPPFWSFVPMPGTSAWVCSAPHPSEPPPHLALTRLADTAEGFSCFRLDL